MSEFIVFKGQQTYGLTSMPDRGPGHHSEGMGTRACLGCNGANRPAKGGFYVQKFFFCALHERRKAKT